MFVGISISLVGKLRAGVSAYAIGSFEPDLVFDFEQEYYRTSGTDTTFDNAITHTRSGNATMVDSDGVLKWAPHNLLTYSEDFASQPKIADTGSNLPVVTSNATTAPDGQVTADRAQFDTGTGTYSLFDISQPGIPDTGIISFWAKSVSGTNQEVSAYCSGPFPSQGQGFTVTSEWQKFSVEVDPGNNTGSLKIGLTATFNTATTSGIYLWGAHLYRSDLGGMVDNPDRGDSYVPTTSAARYLARRGHHVYNGTAWVNEGMLHESEARTNLNAESNSFTISGNVVLTQNSAVSPDGTINAALAEDNNDSNANAVLFTPSSPTAGNNVTSSIFLKYAAGSGWVAIVHRSSASSNQFFAWFDVLNGVVGTNEGGTGTMTYVDHGIEDWGNGWYRCFTVGRDSTDSQFNGFVTSASSDGDKGRETGNDVYVWENQVELASKPSSPIPTSGSTVTRAADSMIIPAAKLPYDATNMSIAMEGTRTFADINGDNGRLFMWRKDNSNEIFAMWSTFGKRTGAVYWSQEESGVRDIVVGPDTSYSPGINVPFNIASRHGSTFLNGAVDGTALTADTTPTALPDLSTTDLQLGYDYMGTISLFRIWADDLGDSGISEASS